MTAFNGIEAVIDEMYSSFDSDISITHKKLKTFKESEFDYSLLKTEKIENYSKAIEQPVAIKNQERTTWGKLIGVEKSFFKMVNIKEHLIEESQNCASLDCFFENVKKGILIAPGIAEKINIETENAEVKILSAKRKYERKKPYKTSVQTITGFINFNKEINESVVLSSLSNAQNILQYPNEISNIYVNVIDKSQKEEIKAELQRKLGQNFVVKTNLEKHDLIYKTSKSEKSMLMTILVFIFFLAAINLVSSLIILFVQKKEETQTLLALGIKKSTVRNVYFLTGLLISFFGLLFGLLLGYILCFIQIKYNIISIDNGSIPYPMNFKIMDVVYIFTVVLCIGGLFSWASSRLLSRNLS